MDTGYSSHLYRTYPIPLYAVEGYTKEIVNDFEQRLDTIFSRQVNRVHILDFAGLTDEMGQSLTNRMSDIEMGLDVHDTICFQLDMDVLRAAPSYTFIRDPVRRLYHRKEERSLINTSFLGEYECSSLALEREGRDKKKRLDHLKQDQEMLIGRHLGLGSPRNREELAAAAGALEVAEGSPIVDDGVQANSAPIQAPQPPPAATLVVRTIP
ncbi:hypothetical protein Tco_0703365 [Tanacetum coccineum]|uniref:Uncharacterized protein n=1 Tax=Tanacetum coccineum TaxID=301880 RepID=A0ABQ4XYL1_9ASTR